MGSERRAELESVRVTNALRDDIVMGRRAPGSRLVERDIAADLGVSRLPVREAIRALAAEGIVVSRPRTGATVREYTIKDIRDFAEFREAVETLAFVLAAQRHDEEGAALMSGIHERERAAAAEGDIERARVAASEFHLAAVSLAGNGVIADVGRTYVTRLRWLFGRHETVLAMADEHRRILDAFLARDVDALRVLIPEHLAQGREDAERRHLAQTGGML